MKKMKMKNTSEYVKVRRSILEDLLRDALGIANREKSDGIANSGDAYANALGRSNAQGRDIANKLNYLLEGK